MLSESTTIHWHGVKQEGTPYMDGVPYVSQCPIHPGETFRYKFKALDSGTFFWHSHIGSQRTDGLYGSVIVHPSFEQDVHRDLYDFDNHHMIISDWIHFDSNSGFVKEYYDRIGINPETIIVNGKGRLNPFTRNNTLYYTPTELFAVDQGKKYRFRLINAGADDCPIRLSFDQHTMKVLSLDAKDIHPVVVDAIDIWPGERVDFVIDANQNPDTYWVRLRGFGLCARGPTTGAFQVARLWYKSTTLHDPSSPIGYNITGATNQTRVLNPYQTGTEASPFTNINVPLLTSMEANDESLAPTPDEQIYISFDSEQIDNYDFHRKNLYGYNQTSTSRAIGTMQLNHITLKLPTVPLMSQWSQIDQSNICNSTTINRSQCLRESCACTHVLKVKLGSIVELVLIDEGKNTFVSNHPLHLHGHFFRVVATEKLEGVVSPERVQNLDQEGKIKRRLDGAPIKDTIKAPTGGFTIIRFHANNPGYWFFHCHFEQHAITGMALVFKVGEHEDFPPIPQGFPTCGNYEPPVWSK
ncbi:hypothetical protein QAD02_019240 [Eretmocerus hayati]|uniref:Uncharacterized protein n=1 Tax=Eretmocerus hayati TaxID=131215 RepID=A0ACC2PK87_9HYME|nr:hypothetical protein QAD02_019240 [Eretmocerus hayati]